MPHSKAGHFNDFVQVVRLRAGIRRALEAAPDRRTRLCNPWRGDFPSVITAVPRLRQPRRRAGTGPGQAKVRRGTPGLPVLSRASCRSPAQLAHCASEPGTVRPSGHRLPGPRRHRGRGRILGGARDREPSRTHPGRRVFLATVLDYFRLEYAIHSENYLVPNRLKEFEKRFREQLRAAMDARRGRGVGGTVGDSPRSPASKGPPLQQEHGARRVRLGSTSSMLRRRAEVDPDVLRGDRYRDFILRLMRKLKDADYLFEETARNGE